MNAPVNALPEAIQTINAADLPAEAGAPLAGGFFAGLINKTNGLYAVIDMGKAHEAEAAYGGYGEKIDAASTCDGNANTAAMAEAGHDVAKTALEKGMAIASRDELDIMYRQFKPTTQENYCGYRDGDNPSSVPPGLLYTEDSPAQTTVESHKAGGPEAFDPVWYLSSTQFSASRAFGQLFVDGGQDVFYKSSKARVRLVRTIKVIQ